MNLSPILIALFLLLFSFKGSYGQPNVLDPNDPNLVFTSSNQPTAPTYNRISKWGHTNRLSWNPYNYGYKAYYFKGMAFRVKFPKTYQHNVVDGKVYPAILFLHGLGEPGNIWDNEFHLVHGAQTHAQRVDDGTFDGFMIYPQSQSGYLQSYFPILKDLADSMAKYVKLDLDRIHVGGLSSGGQATWDFPQQQQYAKIAASLVPISAAQGEDIQYFTSHITIPVLTGNGGQDVAPYPQTVTQIINEYKSRGGNIEQVFVPTAGHGAWNQTWADPRYWPFINTHHKANPLVYFQHDKFCPGETVNVKLGLQAGFAAYEWQKDGVTIPGQTSNELIVTSFGTYRGRFKRTATSNWSVWSPTPAMISENTGLVPPPIQIQGLRSNVLPAPDGSTTVPLSVPNTYATYEWRNIPGDVLVSSANTLNAPVGEYKVKVTEQFGCGSDFSAPHIVVSANGANGPDAASSVSAITISNSSIQLYWNDNPSPAYNETGFEIYRSETTGSGYSLVAITGADVLSYVDQGLSADKKYYYIIRAINSSAASAVSAEVNATTSSDTTPPTAPGSLTVTGSTRNSVSLSWFPSTDDVGVVKYEVYVNGLRSFVTTNLTFTVNNLTALTSYTFFVKALDEKGNNSPASNQVTAVTVLKGINYKYYTFSGTWNNLPDFTTLTPVATGIMSNIAITPRTQNDLFAFLWEGQIIIPVSGTYYFRTNSDDGSRLWLGSLGTASSPYSFSGTPIVNNDGLHGSQDRTSVALTLTAGVYPIAIAFYEQSGGESMAVSWRTPLSGTSFVTIPSSAFVDAPPVAGSAPDAPSGVSALAITYKQINLTWTDNSNNETGFEIWRSTNANTGFITVGNAPANATSYQDSSLAAGITYYYKIRAIGQYGESVLVPRQVATQANWNLNNNTTDASGNGRVITLVNGPVYSTDMKEGSHSIDMDGSNDDIDLTTSAGDYLRGGYTEKTVAFWMKSDVSNSNRGIFDFGGSDNGLAMYINANQLIAGVASSNTRINISTPYSSIGWNHVALVYSANTLRLYLNGTLAASNTNLGFTSVGTTTNASRIGDDNSTTALNTAFGQWDGHFDAFWVIGNALTPSEVSSLYINSTMPPANASATTLPLPSAPANPSNLVAGTVTTSEIGITWDDNSTNEASFEIHRSVATLNNYRLLATIPGGAGATKSYIDSSLFANTDYYYKVRAKGEGGASGFTSDLLVRTSNNAPVITNVSGFTMRHGSQKIVGLSATDIDLETLTFSFLDPLPGFAVFTNTGNGSATIQFNPTLADQGVYNISAVIADGNNGKDTTTFVVTVNDNYTPVISALSNVTIAENSNSSFNLSATDQDGNGTLTWVLSTPHSFINLTDNGNGAGTLTVTPGYIHAGVYPVTVTANDGSGGSESANFTLTVTNVEPPVEKWYISTKYNSPNAPAPWNNVATVNTNNLLNGDGVSTSVGIQFLNTNWNAGDAGAVTGNNSGAYPDAVIKDYFWFGIYGAPNTVDFNLKGLTPGAKYDVTLFGSSTWRGAGNVGTTIYTINGNAKPLYVDYNQHNTVSFSSVYPDALGNITVNMSKGANTPYGLVNAIVLEKPFDDGSAPVLPTGLTALALSDGMVKLNWNDIAYNEANYLVHRATAPGGPFTVLNPGASNANDITYIDNTVLSNTTYYYKLEATNLNGTSGLTDSVIFTTLNKAPVLGPLADAYVKAGNSISVSILPTDDIGDILTTTVTGLPSFGVFQSTGNGTGNIMFTPSVDVVGKYTGIVVQVTDNNGASVTRSFSITVTDNSVRSAYLNFGPDGATPQAEPWNNYLGYPFINYSYGGIKDDANVLTGFTFKFLSQWNGGLSIGMRTGNDKGVFPDNVMRHSFVNYNGGNHVIQFDGLNPAKRYSIGFLTNVNTGQNSLVTFTNGSQSVTVNGRYNTSSLANLNGLVPNGSGSIQVTISKDASNPRLSLNGVVIREYDPSDPVIKPSDLFAETVVQTDKIVLTWSDRSIDETGFEIWRSTAENGTYTLIGTVSANTTSYTNTGLTANTRYYYKVRSVKDAVNSNFSNVANAIVALKIVLINQNVASTLQGPLPWNNTTSPSTVGATFSNLINTEFANSGFEMVITKEFNGTGFAGVNGSGIFPANVMVSNYWTDAGQTSQVRFQNLDLSKKYRIGSFGSNTNNDYTTANYSINGRTVELNSYLNDSKVVYLENLRPGNDGELILSVSTAGGSPYSFTGAYTIEFYDDASPDEPLINTIYTDAPPPMRQVPQPGLITHVLPPPDKKAEAKQLVPAPEISRPEIRVFPNPFTNSIQLSLKSEKAATISIVLYDINGRLAFSRSGMQVTKGSNMIPLNISNEDLLPSGIYILNVLIDGKVSKVEKLVKVN